MEGVKIALDADRYDKAIHGGLDGLPVLPEGGDLAVYVKPRATANGKPGAVLTFTVQLPDGTAARAQAATTLALFEAMASACRGWRDGGHL